MINFLMFCGVALSGVFMYMLYNWIMIPRSKRDVKRTAANLKALKKNSDFAIKRRAALTRAAADLFRDLKIFRFNNRYVSEVNLVLAGLDKKVDGKPMTVDNVYVTQCCYALASVAGGLLMTLGAYIALQEFQPFPLVLIPLAPLMYTIPLNNLKSELQKEQVEAMSQFHEFYDLYYCQFIRKENNLLLMDVVQNFIPLANPALRRVLERFLIDLESGEEVALNKLNDRYPNNQRIHKFVSVALMRMQGDEAAFDVMKSFRAEQYQDIQFAREDDLKARFKKASTVINTVMYVLIVCFMIVMCVAVLTS